MPRRRLLLAIPSLRCGGSERVITILASYWAERGDEVAIATFDGPETDFFTLDSRVRRFVVGGTGRAGAAWLAANRDRLQGLRQAIRETKPHAVVSFIYTMNLLALLAARGLAPVVAVERTDPRQFPVERWQAALRRLLYPTAAAVVVQTADVLRGWARLVALPGRALAIPNPVLPPRAGEWRGAPLPVPFVAGIGRLERGKGFDVLVDAFAAVADEYQEWSVALLGEGAEREALTRQAERLGVAGRVVLAGTGDAAAFLARAGAFVTTSRVEGFPNALLEAMASGLPVVAADCRSGPREIVRPGVDGYLVEVDDSAATAAALGALLGDERRRIEFGARAREVLDRFGVERVAASWDELFARVAR